MMEKKTYYLNAILTTLVGLVLAAAVMVRSFWPAVILPVFSIPNAVLISLAALVLDYYLAPGAKRCYICVALFSALTFGVLPWAAGFLTAVGLIQYGLAGAAIFTVVTFLFSTMTDRISSGPAAKAAPVISAVGLYLAAQIFQGL